MGRFTGIMTKGATVAARAEALGLSVPDYKKWLHQINIVRARVAFGKGASSIVTPIIYELAKDPPYNKPGFNMDALADLLRDRVKDQIPTQAEVKRRRGWMAGKREEAAVRVVRKRASALDLSVPQYRKWMRQYRQMIHSLARKEGSTHQEARAKIMAIMDAHPELKRPGFDRQLIYSLAAHPGKETSRGNSGASRASDRSFPPLPVSQPQIERIAPDQQAIAESAARESEAKEREAIAFATGYTLAWLSNYADSASISRQSLTQGVGRLLLRSPLR